ncbi:MAG: triose-phosphate isomerase [Deltaproteobacteria bacterium]|nr:triose-phosphate isomerase [Deltaproteobacteria bacterium]
MPAERQPLIAGNWKMHQTLSEARALARNIRGELAPAARAEVALAPPYTALTAVYDEISSSPVRLAAQDAHWQKQGAFTGAISPVMLRDAGCRYVIVGHSERRQHFGETDATVNLKLKAVLDVGLCPILCVGETIEQRQAQVTLEVVTIQLRQGLAEITGLSGENLVIAYEPVWAIGTGLTATPDQAQEVHGVIRRLLAVMQIPAQDIRLLYGGSVTPENSAALLAQPDIDGALVGGASLKADSFLKIIAAAG